MSDKYQVAGMDLLMVDEPGKTYIPLAALVILESMDSDGNVVNVVTYTDGLTDVKALGFAEYAKLDISEQLKFRLARIEQEDIQEAIANGTSEEK